MQANNIVITTVANTLMFMKLWVMQARLLVMLVNVERKLETYMSRVTGQCTPWS